MSVITISSYCHINLLTKLVSLVLVYIIGKVLIGMVDWLPAALHRNVLSVYVYLSCSSLIIYDD